MKRKAIVAIVVMALAVLATNCTYKVKKTVTHSKTTKTYSGSAVKPFDRIIITAGAPTIPETLIQQLKPNGIMVIPMDNAEGEGQTMLKITKLEDGSLKKEEFGDFKFVPMLKEIGND